MSKALILSNMTTIVNGMGEVGSFWVRQLSDKMSISENLIWDALRAARAEGEIYFDSNHNVYKPIKGRTSQQLQIALSDLASKGFKAHQAGWAKCVVSYVRNQSMGRLPLAA